MVTPEKSKFTKQGEPNLTAHLNELLRTNKPEQQNTTFWFPTPQNPGEPEHQTLIQTRSLKELIELKEKEKFNAQESTESRTKFLKRFDWTDTLLTETRKQATEDILIESYCIYSRHRMDIGTNTEFKVKITPKDDKTVYSQSLPMPIHLKEDLSVNLLWCTSEESSRYCLPINTQHPYFHSVGPLGKYVFLWIFVIPTVWLRMTVPTTIIQLASCQTQHNTWQGSFYSANYTAVRPITVSRLIPQDGWKT